MRSLLEAYESTVSFYAPDICFDDARKYIPNLAVPRKFDPTSGFLVLDALSKLVEPVDISLYGSYEELARIGNIDQRILGRSIAAESALHSRESGEVIRKNAAMKKLAAQFNSVP